MTQIIDLASKDVKTVIINTTPFDEKPRRMDMLTINMENTEKISIKHLQMKKI